MLAPPNFYEKSPIFTSLEKKSVDNGTDIGIEQQQMHRFFPLYRHYPLLSHGPIGTRDSAQEKWFIT